MLRRTLHITGRVLLFIVCLLLLAYALLHHPRVQTWLVQKASYSLSKELGAKVHIESVDIRLLHQLSFKKLIVLDKKGDTLLWAGSANMRITDWFFLKKQSTLHYAELTDGFVHLKRSNDQWNYQFILDYFGQSSSKSSKETKPFHIKRIKLRHIRFRYEDEWLGENWQCSFDELDLRIQHTDFANNRLQLQTIKLQKPIISHIAYDGKKNSTEPHLSASASATNKPWTIEIGQLLITDGRFQYDLGNPATAVTGLFDGQHFLFNNITGTFTNLTWNNGQLQSTIQLSSANERNGLSIKKLGTRFTLNDTSMVFQELDLDVNNSHFENYFSMRFTDMQKDMNAFFHRVNIVSNLRNTTIASNDLGIFIPDLKNTDYTIQLETSVNGTLDNLTCNGMQLRFRESLVKGDLQIQHLPDVDNAYINLNVQESQLSQNDLNTLLPSYKNIRNINTGALGNIRYKGNFIGFPRDFIAKGTLSTDLGTVETDIQYTIPANNKSSYSGRISTHSFSLGQFLRDTRIGQITLDGKIEGGYQVGLTTSGTRFEGFIQQVGWNGYNYRQIQASGSFGNNHFEGTAAINDPNLVIRNLSGRIQFQNNHNEFNLEADIEHADLQKLHLSINPLQLSAHAHLNFNGNDIDHFLGEARISDLRLFNGLRYLTTDSLIFSSTVSDLGKTLSVYNNEIAAQCVGDFKIMEIPDAFRYFLHKYYPLYVPQPEKRLSAQHFSFGLVTKNIEDYLTFFNTPLRGGNDMNITGYLDLSTTPKTQSSENSNFALSGTIPFIQYNKTAASNITFSSNNEHDTLMTELQFSDLHLDDSLYFTNSNLRIESHNDFHDIQLDSRYKNTGNSAKLHGHIHTHANGYDIQFKPSSFILNNKEWTLEKDGRVHIQKDMVDVSDVVFSNGQQAIKLKSEDDQQSGQMNLVLAFKNIDMADFSDLANSDVTASGIFNGKAVIRQILDNPSIETSGEIEALSLNNRMVGNTRFSGDYTLQSKTGNVQLSTDDQANQFSIDGALNFSDTATETIAMNMEAKSIRLDILEPYLKGVFSQINGIASGQLRYTQPRNESAALIGKMMLDSTLLKVDYTQVTYRANKQSILLEKDRILLQSIQLKDSLQNSMSLNGSIRHKGFNEIFLDNLKIESSKIALLNTKRSDNPYFWGNITGQVQTIIHGPVNDFKIDIKGEPNRVDTSQIYLNTDYSGESRSFDYIYFKNADDKSQRLSTISSSNNISVSLNISANPACKVDVILDEETKDIIKGTGTGEIKINTGSSQPLTISGTYNLTRGEYTFNFQTFFKKPFTLLQGGVIRWDKNPYDAFIDMKAEYVAGGVDISALSTSSGLNRREDIRIISSLRGSLKNPEIHFTFELPDKSENRRDDVLVKRLADFQNDENEMNKQVASLLLFNTFILGDQNLFTQGTASNLITRSIGGMMSNLLTGFLNRELKKATNGILSTYIDISPTLDLQRNVSQVQANVKAGLKILLSNRLEVLVGGQLDYNNPALAQYLDRRGLITPDINVEWIINRDGSLRVIGFNRSSIDISMNQRNRSGLQLSYRKESNRFSDIFRRRRKGDPD